MKEKLFSLTLFGFEVLFFLLVNYILNIPFATFSKFGYIWFLLLYAFKHYKIESTLIWNEIKNVFKSLTYSIALVFAVSYPDLSYFFKIVIVLIIMMFITILIDRTMRIFFRKHLARKTLIIGTGGDAYRIGKISNNNRFALTSLQGFVKVPNEEVYQDIYLHDNYKVYEYKDLYEIIDSQNIQQVIISVSQSNSELLDSIHKNLHGKVKYVKVAPKLDFTMTFDSKIHDFDGILLVSTARGSMNGMGVFLKRCLDICAGLAGCMVLLPLTFYVKHKNKKSGDHEPVFFVQERIGLNGKPIKIYKYRSMVPNAEAVLEEMMEKDPAIKEEYLTNKKIVNDPRITEVGHFLRRTSLDEFPQFINVLKGEMSFVGPRPYLFREIEDMDIYYDSIIKCKPGITGMWQANGRSDVGFEDRCKLDDYYYKNWNFGLDLIIIYKTVKGVIYGKGAL